MMKQKRFYEKPEDTALFTLPGNTFVVTAIKQPTGRVSFEVEGDAMDFERVLRDFAEDRPVGMRTLLEAVRRTRTLMFQTKQAGGAR